MIELQINIHTISNQQVPAETYCALPVGNNCYVILKKMECTEKFLVIASCNDKYTVDEEIFIALEHVVPVNERFFCEFELGLFISEDGKLLFKKDKETVLDTNGERIKNKLYKTDEAWPFDDSYQADHVETGAETLKVDLETFIEKNKIEDDVTEKKALNVE